MNRPYTFNPMQGVQIHDEGIYFVSETTTDSYAKQFRSAVGVVLDSVAPLRTKFKQRGLK